MKSLCCLPLSLISMALSGFFIPLFAETMVGNSDDSSLIAGVSRAVAYSGFREGQHPDRGNGAVNPSDSEILEDLRILVAHDFHLIRLYDSGENSATTLRIIREHQLPIRVMLGIWLDAEISNHEACAWLNDPIPADALAANRLKNEAEVKTAIDLANKYSDVVVAINVGNEALVGWTDHLMPLDRVIGFVREVKSGTSALVTVADNCDWWTHEGELLGQEVDFLGVHCYPLWEGETLDNALRYTSDKLTAVQAAIPGKPVALLEVGWATTATEFGDRAGEPQQKSYFEQLMEWVAEHHTTAFFFEAFDEPWKGDPNNALGAEKHWGLFYENRKPKAAMQ